jgi:hypothetical protein
VGAPEQVGRIQQMFTSGHPPPAHHPHWPLFASKAMASIVEMVDGLLKEHEPKRRGRPPKKPDKGDAA